MEEKKADFKNLLPYADVEDGLGRIMGKQAIYCRVLRNFRNGPLIQNLIEKIELGSVEMIAQDAHTLKGTVANLGLHKLHETAFAIEIKAKGGMVPDTAELRKTARLTYEAIDVILENLS
jgi:chemotaxis protein histidine kinase CheA